MLTRVRSRNHDCAETKPFTLLLMARIEIVDDVEPRWVIHQPLMGGAVGCVFGRWQDDKFDAALAMLANATDAGTIVEEGYQAISVDAVVERLSHPYVFEGRVSGLDPAGLLEIVLEVRRRRSCGKCRARARGRG